MTRSSIAGESIRVLRAASILPLLLGAATPAAAERLCDPAHEDCRALLLDYIRAERSGIDVAFWFMEDGRYANELVAKAREGVPVRVIVDPRANAEHPVNAQLLDQLAAAGIPMRMRVATGILHWKMMLFVGQQTVEFSGANFSPDAFRPLVPYSQYVDEVIYFTDALGLVQSFMRRYDDLWTNTAAYQNYANVSTPTRRYPQYSVHPDLNFPPEQSYRNRAVSAFRSEPQAIDATMYRITDRAYTDALIAAIARGVRVRLITEPQQYRDPTRAWHSWNVDRLYVAGAHIRHRAHVGLTHQKSVVLRGQSLAVFGSSNWTSPSSDTQEEHNYFTTKGWIVQWLNDQFERKWNNFAPAAETAPFQPLPPDVPAPRSPTPFATRVSTTAVLVFDAGPFAHLYDIYFGRTPNPPLLARNVELGPTLPGGAPRRYQLPPLASNTTYYWRIVARTMAIQERSGDVWAFSTGASIDSPPSIDGDFNGDAIADITVFRPSNGTWYLRLSNSGTGTVVQWGSAADQPVAGDYDGDGRNDIAVFRPSNGFWYVISSSTGQASEFRWGSGSDVPVPADYDGDGRADIAVFRPSNGVWYVTSSTTGGGSEVRWGAGSDVPVAADYDGDGRSDVAVFRPSNGTWYLVPSRTGTMTSVRWGGIGDLPVPGDYDGDGRADIAVFRPSNGTWYLVRSSTSRMTSARWGGSGDVPVPGDFDGDGRDDIAVFRPSNGTWYIVLSSTGTGIGIQWGGYGDRPILERRGSS